jgi:hypothetical protein
MGRKTQHSGWAGTYAVAAELSRRGYDVALTVGNTRGFDLFCASPSGKTFKVEVKGASTRAFVPIGKSWLEAEPDTELFLIVALAPTSEREPFRFFVLSHPEARSLWEAAPRTKLSSEPLAPGWEGFNWAAVVSFEGRWNILPT